MSGDTQTRRFLVLHDYGMGGLWWWITAFSAEEITSAFAEVEVIDDAETIGRASSWNLADLSMAQAMTGPLADLYATRLRQRQDPSFGKLLGKSSVCLRLHDPDVDESIWYSEHDQTGRRTRQVEVRPDGSMDATSPSDWPFNPPYDLGDPWMACFAISPEEFEEVWQHATKPGTTTLRASVDNCWNP